MATATPESPKAPRKTRAKPAPVEAIATESTETPVAATKKPAAPRKAAAKKKAAAAPVTAALPAAEPPAAAPVPAEDAAPPETVQPAVEPATAEPLAEELAAATAELPPTVEAPVEAGTASVEERIRLAAYRRYAERGFTDGNSLDDWIQAEREVAG